MPRRPELLLEHLKVCRQCLRRAVFGRAVRPRRRPRLVLHLRLPPRMQLLHVMLVVLRARRVTLLCPLQMSWRTEVGRPARAVSGGVPDMPVWCNMPRAEVAGSRRRCWPVHFQWLRQGRRLAYPLTQVHLIGADFGGGVRFGRFGEAGMLAVALRVRPLHGSFLR